MDFEWPLVEKIELNVTDIVTISKGDGEWLPGIWE